MRVRADRSWQPAALVIAALAVPLDPSAATAQTYLQADDAAQETYVVDSKGTTLYRNGVRVCRVNCNPTVTAARIAPPASPTYAPPPTGAAPAPRAAPPRTSRYVAADRIPIRPSTPVPPPVAVAAAPASYPVLPYPVRETPGSVSAPPPAPALAQRTAPPAAAPADNLAPKKSDGLSKEQKALLLNAGGVLAVTAYGLVFWDYFQTAPKADGEGWFGRTTKFGGADKLGHAWSTYAFGHLISYVYRWWDFDSDQANTLGALSSLGIQTLMEAGDSFSADYGFSYEDELMNVAGAAAAYVLGKYPELARKIDFRFEYAPKKLSDLKNDVLTNYDNQRYLIALKLDGFDMFHDSYLSYLELQAGYYTRGYQEWDPGEPDNRRRHLYFGVGFNVSKLVQQFVHTSVFDYVQVPYTSIGVSKGLD